MNIILAFNNIPLLKDCIVLLALQTNPSFLQSSGTTRPFKGQPKSTSCLFTGWPLARSPALSVFQGPAKSTQLCYNLSCLLLCTLTIFLLMICSSHHHQLASPDLPLSMSLYSLTQAGQRPQMQQIQDIIFIIHTVPKILETATICK